MEIKEIYLLLANLLICSLLTGFIWFIQIVHYPIFAKVSPESFESYHHFHTEGTGLVVALPMVIELGLAMMLLFNKNDVLPFYVNMILAGMVIIIWIVTFLIAIPLHEQLTRKGFQVDIIEKLVWINWARTIPWTIRFGVLIYYVLCYIEQK